MRAMLPHTEGRVDRDGIELHYEIYGQGRHTIVFVSSWAIVHSRSWKAQIPYFAEHFRVVTFDPRGNGKSDRPATADDYAIDLIIEDVTAVMDATSTKKAILFGFSFGSEVAFAVAAKHPERVEAVISSGLAATIVPPLERKLSDRPGEDGRPVGWAKANPDYWRKNYPDWTRFFMGQLNNEPHSTKQFDDSLVWAGGGDGDMLAMTVEQRPSNLITEKMYRAVKCPVLLIHAENDAIRPAETSRRIAKLTNGKLVVRANGGHAVHGRFPSWFNLQARDFLARHLGTWNPVKRPRTFSTKRVLYLSSPIGLGHARRDLAVTRELHKLHPDIEVDWLAQDPVTRFLDANSETIHPASKLLANESAHIEAESGEHDLNAFQAIRNMDEILIKNFMIFQEVLEQDEYDLVIADEAWDVDHFWHEHPELKQT